MENEKATDRLSVKPSTRRRFAEFCGKGRSYDVALNELLDYWQENHFRVINTPCQICGDNEVGIEKHHILKPREGGGDDDGNISLLCPTCHPLVDIGKIGEKGKSWLEQHNITEDEFWVKVHNLPTLADLNRRNPLRSD